MRHATGEEGDNGQRSGFVEIFVNIYRISVNDGNSVKFRSLTLLTLMIQ